MATTSFVVWFPKELLQPTICDNNVYYISINLIAVQNQTGNIYLAQTSSSSQNFWSSSYIRQYHIYYICINLIVVQNQTSTIYLAQTYSSFILHSLFPSNEPFQICISFQVIQRDVLDAPSYWTSHWSPFLGPNLNMFFNSIFFITMTTFDISHWFLHFCCCYWTCCPLRCLSVQMKSMKYWLFSKYTQLS